MCFNGLWGHIFRLLEAPTQLGANDVPGGGIVFVRKRCILVFSHNGCKGPVFPCANHFLSVVIPLSSFFTQTSLHYVDKGMIPCNMKDFVEIHYFCVQTYG